MGRPRGSGRGGYRGRGRGGAGRGALVAQNADPIPVSTVDGPASPDSASVNELPLNGASPIDTEAGNETAATSSSEVSASNSESVPAPVVRGRSKGGRPRGRGRGGRGRGTGTASKVVEEDISRPQTDEDRLSRGPPEKPRRLGLRGGRAYKTRRATEAQQILAMDWPASNPSDLLATADYSSFTLPEVNTQDRRGVLRAKRESQLANTTVDQLIERAEELRSFFNEGAKVLIDQNLIDAVHTVKSIDAMTPSEVQQMEWYRNVRKELEQSETDAIARLEQFFQTQMRSLDIMRDGQCEKLFESTSNRCYEAMDRAVLQFLRSGDSPLSEFFELIPPKFTEYVLSKTRHDKVEDVTRNDLIIYFESSEGNNRSKFDLPQVNTRSNRGLYDRKVLPTRGAILREKLAEHWDQIKHLFDLNGPDLPASELLHKAVQNPEKLPVDLLKAFEDYHGTALVALEWESKILRDQIREHWRELGHKFGPHNVDSLSPQQIVYVIQSHPDGVPKDIWSTINRYHDTIYPYAELTFTPVSKRPEMLELRETRPDYNLQKTTEIKRKRETEDANISKKRKMTDSAQAVQLKGKMAASPAQADRGRKRKYTEGETRPTTKIRRTAANRKTYIAFEIPEDCHDEGEDSDPEMQATYLGALFGGISAPLALVNDYHHDTRNHAQFRDPSIKTSHELRAAEGLTTIGMAAQRVTGTAGHQPSLTSLDDDTETMDSGGYSEDLEESDADNMDVEQYPEINIDEHAMVNGSAGFGRPVAIDKPSVSEEAIVAERPAIMPNGPVIVDKPVVINEQIPTSANGTTTENLAYEQEPIQSRILAEMENTQNRNNNGHSVRAITNKESNPESTAHRLRDRRPATNGVVSNGKNAVAPLIATPEPTTPLSHEKTEKYSSHQITITSPDSPTSNEPATTEFDIANLKEPAGLTALTTPPDIRALQEAPITPISVSTNQEPPNLPQDLLSADVAPTHRPSVQLEVRDQEPALPLDFAQEDATAQDSVPSPVPVQADTTIQEPVPPQNLPNVDFTVPEPFPEEDLAVPESFLEEDLSQANATTPEPVPLQAPVQVDAMPVQESLPPQTLPELAIVASKEPSLSRTVLRSDVTTVQQEPIIPSSEQTPQQSDSMQDEEDEDVDIPGAGVIDFASDGMFIAPQAPRMNADAHPPDASVSSADVTTETPVDVSSDNPASNLRPNGRPREPPRKKRGRPRDSRPLYSFKVDRQKADQNAAKNRESATNPHRPKGTRMSIRGPAAPRAGQPPPPPLPPPPPPVAPVTEVNGASPPPAPIAATGYIPSTPPLAAQSLPMGPPPLPVFPPAAATPLLPLGDVAGWPRNLVSNRQPALANPPTPAVLPAPNYGFPPRPQFLVPPRPPAFARSVSMVPRRPRGPPVRYYVGNGRYVDPPPILDDEDGDTVPTAPTTSLELPHEPSIPPDVELASQVDEQLFEDLLYGSEYSFAGI